MGCFSLDVRSPTKSLWIAGCRKRPGHVHVMPASCPSLYSWSSVRCRPRDNILVLSTSSCAGWADHSSLLLELLDHNAPAGFRIHLRCVTVIQVPPFGAVQDTAHPNEVVVSKSSTKTLSLNMHTTKTGAGGQSLVGFKSLLDPMSYRVGPAAVYGLNDFILDSFPAAYRKGAIELCSIMGSLVSATKAACRNQSTVCSSKYTGCMVADRHGVQIGCPGNLLKHLGLAECECCRHLGCFGEV